MRKNQGRKKPLTLFLTILLSGVLLLGGGFLTCFIGLDIKAEASKLGVFKRKAENYGTVLSVVNDYNVVQAGKGEDLYHIPAGEKYLYIYKSMDVPLTFQVMKPMLSYDLLLVNRSHRFKDATETELEFLGENRSFSNASTARMRTTVAEQLKSMLNAAYRDGFRSIILTGAYRSISTQKRLFSDSYSYWERIVPDPYTKTNEKVAKPGYSEHHTGMAADIVSKGATGKTFGGTAFYRWMKKNSSKFGFIERYPKGKEKITKYIWESWHYRYVGKPFAKYLTEHKLTLEEFIEKLRVEEPPVIEYAAKKYHLVYVKGAENIFAEDGVEYELYKLTSTEKLLVILE